jgi:hypothetical protein
MTESYAVVWREGDGPLNVGKLEVGGEGVRLSSGGRTSLVVTRASITAVDVQHPGAGLLGDLRTVTIGRRHTEPVTIGALNGIGVVFEIADVVAQLLHRPKSRWSGVAVSVPIRRERAEKVRELLRQGPPFDPSTMDGLDRHFVFMGEAEVVFIFEGSNVQAAVERLTRQPRLWLAATSWRDCLAGRPTVIEGRYAWRHQSATAVEETGSEGGS